MESEKRIICNRIVLIYNVIVRFSLRLSFIDCTDHPFKLPSGVSHSAGSKKNIALITHAFLESV